MARIRITEREVKGLPAPDPSGKQRLHWDDELRGLAVLCSGVTNAKTFVVQHAIGSRTRRVTIGPCNVLSVVDARDRARRIIGDMYNGIDPKAARGAITLRQALDMYLDARPNLRPATRRDYRSAIEHHLSAWCDRRLRDITADMVEARHRSLRTDVAHRGRYSGNRTANGVMRTVTTLWTFVADREPDLPPCPVRRLRRQWFPVPRRERMVRTDDLPRFYAAVKALPSRVASDYLLLLLFTGLRKTEAGSLTWDDIDFAQRVIRIPATRTKSRRRLNLLMSDFVFDLLVARRAIGREEHVFPSRGGFMTDTGFPLGQVAAATGIGVSAHDLRRTFASIADSCGISVYTLKGLINHSAGNEVMRWISLCAAPWAARCQA